MIDNSDPFSKELYPWKLEEIYESPLTKAKILLNNPPPTFPTKGSIEYELLFQETGGASAIPGFNYEEHIAHTRVINNMPEWLDTSIINVFFPGESFCLATVVRGEVSFE